MKIGELLCGMTPLAATRLLGQLEGMEMAMRICRNRASDLEGTDGMPSAYVQEALNLAGIIRLVQVQIGSGRQTFGPLTQEEQDEINRIY
jgi:hypothetical protein